MNKLAKLLDQELSGRQAWRYAERIAQYNRIQASQGYRDAALQIVSLLRREGIDAGIEDFPARTGTRFLSRQSFQEWNCKSGELWLNEKDGGRRRLSRFQEQEVSLVQRSGPTPPGGITAQLVEVQRAGLPESYSGLDLRGKIALVRGNPMSVYELAVERHGAMGLIFDNLNDYPPLRTRADMPDAIQYTSFWWSGHQQPVFGFCVSPRIGAELREMLKQGEVSLYAQVEAGFSNGTLENVEYFIPGKREEEVLLLAHLCHPYPGAQDNASGPAVLMEVIRTLNRLMDRGDLTQPELGIRFIMVPEMTGTFAYFDRYPQRMNTTVAAFNLDMVGADQSNGGGPLCIEQPPLATPTFTDRYAFSVLASISRDVVNFNGTFGYSTCHYVPTRFSGGSDHYVAADPSIGVPCPMAIQWPDKHYHTSMDHPVHLDPAMLKRVGVMTALFAWGLANGSEAEWLEFLFADLGGRGSHLHTALESVFANKSLRADWPRVLEFYLDYEGKALAQLGKYAQLRGFTKLAAKVEWAKDYMTDTGKQVSKWAKERAAQAGPGENPKEGLAPAAAARIYRRVYPGPLDLQAEMARLPLERRLEWSAYTRSSMVSSGYATFLQYWLDGRRTLGEVLDLVRLESGAWHPDFALKFLDICGELGLILEV